MYPSKFRPCTFIYTLNANGQAVNVPSKVSRQRPETVKGTDEQDANGILDDNLTTVPPLLTTS
jgi:hypothetical protein